MSNDMVLVWHKNRGGDCKAIIHVNADCSTIATGARLAARAHMG